MFIQIVFDSFDSNQRYVQKSVKVAMTQQILPVTFDNVIFNFHDGRDKSGTRFGNGGNAKPDQARSRDIASLICFVYVPLSVLFTYLYPFCLLIFIHFVYVSFAQSVFQQFLYLLVRLQVFGKIANEVIDYIHSRCATALVPQNIEIWRKDHHLVCRRQMFQVFQPWQTSRAACRNIERNFLAFGVPSETDLS